MPTACLQEEAGNTIAPMQADGLAIGIDDHSWGEWQQNTNMHLIVLQSHAVVY